MTTTEVNPRVDGEPLSLTPVVPGENLAVKAIGILADTNIVRDAFDSRSPVSIADTDLRRQAAMDKYDASPNHRALEDASNRADGWIKIQEQEGWFDKIVNKIANSTSTKEMALQAQYSRDLIIRNLDAQKYEIGEMMEMIQGDPGLLELVVTRAQEEAKIVQRIAFGKAIRHMTNSIELSDEQANQFVEAYNSGKLQVTGKEFAEASNQYKSLVSRLKTGMFATDKDDSSNDKQLQNLAVESFFDPKQQIRS